MSAPTPTGAHPTTEKRSGGLWWLWLLLGALLLALLAWGIAAAVGGDEEGTAGGPVVTEDVDGAEAVEDPEVPPTAAATGTATAPATGGTGTAPAAGETTPPAAGAATGSAAAAGALLIGGAEALTGDVDLTGLVGQQVQAEAVQVREVVADEAFHVGPDEENTVLVRLADFAGEGRPESPFVVEQGDTVSFTGTLERIDEQFLSQLRNHDPSTRLETGEVYVQVQEISGVR